MPILRHRMLERNDSEAIMRLVNKERSLCGVCGVGVAVDRSWSGNLGCPSRDNNKVIKSSSRFKMELISKDEHRRSQSVESIDYNALTGPKLVRSGGLRRDWSFEDKETLKMEEKK